MDKKKLIAGALIGIAGLGLGVAGGFALDKPDTIIQEKIVKEIVYEDKIVEVEVPKNITVEKIVEVEDESFVKATCDRLMFDDISECKEEVAAEDIAIAKALELIADEAELFDFLEDEDMIKDEDEARVIKVYDDFEDIEIKKSDFEDEEYVFEIKVRVEDEDRDVKKKVWLKVSVEEGEAEFVKVWED